MYIPFHPKCMMVVVVVTLCQLIALLREVKYLLQREVEGQPIPESASAVFAQNDMYRKYIQNLDVIVSLYNRSVGYWFYDYV